MWRILSARWRLPSGQDPLRDQNRLLRWLNVCLAVLCVTGSALAYRWGHANGSRQDIEEQLFSIASVNVQSSVLGTLLLPLTVCARNPDAFTADERERLVLACESPLLIEEKVIIPALERGQTFEPLTLNLVAEQQSVARAKELLAKIKSK